MTTATNAEKAELIAQIDANPELARAALLRFLDKKERQQAKRDRKKNLAALRAHA